jgi:hypothetical protein
MGLEVANAHGTVGIEAENGVEGIDHCRGGGDDESADYGHFALVNVAAPDGEATVNDARDPKHKTEHHNYGQTIAQAGFQIGGIKARALRHSRSSVEYKQGSEGVREVLSYMNFFCSE